MKKYYVYKSFIIQIKKNNVPQIAQPPPPYLQVILNIICPCNVQSMFINWLYHECLPQAMRLLFYNNSLIVNKPL